MVFVDAPTAAGNYHVKAFGTGSDRYWKYRNDSERWIELATFQDTDAFKVNPAAALPSPLYLLLIVITVQVHPRLRRLHHRARCRTIYLLWRFRHSPKVSWIRICEGCNPQTTSMDNQNDIRPVFEVSGLRAFLVDRN